MDEDCSEEAHRVRRIPTPVLPTKQDVEEHELLGCVQYRTWCPHCVASRAVGQRHVAVQEPESAKPKALSEYGYMNGTGFDRKDLEEATGAVDEHNLPIFVLKDKKTKTISASLVPEKGRNNYAIKFFSTFIKRMGHREIVNRSDGEHALVALKTEAAKQAEVAAVPEESVVGDSKANGEIESAVKEVKGIIRATKSNLEKKLGKTLDRKDPMLAWMPTYAADMISRHRVGKDGCTAEKRRTGKNWGRPGFQYGELIHVKEAMTKSAKQARGSYDMAMREGRYLGHHGRTGALLVMTKDGVIRGNGARRMPEERRWSTEGWDELKGLPWDVRPKRRSIARGLVSGSDAVALPIEGPATVPTLDKRSSRMYVTRADIDPEAFGPTDGCPGCTAVAIKGSAIVAHNDRSRMRIAEELSKTEAGRERLEEHRRKRRAVEPAGDKETSDLAVSPVRSQAGKGTDGDAILAQASTTTDLAVSPVRSALRRDRPEGFIEEKAKKKAHLEDVPSCIRRKDAKREAEVATEELQRQSRTDLAVSPVRSERAIVDIEDLVDAPMDADVSASTPSAAACLDICQLELAEKGTVSGLKAELQGVISSFVRDCFAAKQTDVSKEELQDITALCLELGSVDVAEIYSPERFTEMAPRMGLRPGFAVDLQTGWNMEDPEHVQELERMTEEQDPYLLTGSPPCGPFSALQRISRKKRDPGEYREMKDRARHHLKTAVGFYWRQLKRGRYFLHEHPKTAESWQEECVKELEAHPGVHKVTGPMCRWEMTATDKRACPPRTGYVLKETTWLTNCPALAKILAGICSNKDGSKPWHRHVQLIGGIAAGAAVYPPALVRGVLKGIKEQMIEDGNLSSVEAYASGAVAEEPLMMEDDLEEFWDSVNGGYLQTERVREARKEEVEWVRKSDMFDVIPRSEADSKVVDLRWIDTNKGDDQDPRYRSRLVLRDIKARKKEGDKIPLKDLFSSMPPLEMFKAMLSLFVTKKASKRNEPLKLGLFDISRAHFYGKLERRVLAELPEELKADYPGDVVAVLKKSWYGLQDASSIWQSDYTALLEEHGFACGRSNAALFYDPATDCKVLVHGDDFAALGDQKAVDAFEAMLKSKYECKKMANLGFEEGDDKQATFLNRVITIERSSRPYKVVYEPDARHAKLLIESLGLTKASGAETPAEHRSADKQIADSKTPALSAEQKQLYRSCVMRAAYLAQDDPGIGEAVKGLSRHMNAPNEADFQRLKRLGRYLIKYPMTANVMKEQGEVSKIKVCVDTDHAGCALTRRSTTGLATLLGGHCTSHKSNMQSTIGLSSGESEWYGLVKGSAAGLALQSHLADWGEILPLEVCSDSSAARGFAQRRGLGKMRHVQTRYLWVQERVKEGHLTIVPIRGKNNPADLFTKPVSGRLREKFLQTLGFEHRKAAGGQKEVLK